MNDDTEDLVTIYQEIRRPRPKLPEVSQLVQHLTDQDLENLKYAIEVEEAQRQYPDTTASLWSLRNALSACLHTAALPGAPQGVRP